VSGEEGPPLSMDERLAILMARGARGGEGAEGAAAAAPSQQQQQQQQQQQPPLPVLPQKRGGPEGEGGGGDGGDPAAYVRRMRQILDRERTPPPEDEDPPIPPHAARLLDAARARLQARRWADASAHADAARSALLQPSSDKSAPPPPPAAPPPGSAVGLALRAAAQVGAVAAVHAASDSGDWRGLLLKGGGEQQPHQTPQQQAAIARSSYRRLAALVHPDKCDEAHAGEAFAALSTAFQALVEADAAAAEAAAANDGANADDDAAWWAEWDKPPHAQQKPPPPAPAFSDEDLARWRAMPLAELEEETRALQTAVLCPPPSAAAPLSLPQRETRLRAARSVLSDRLDEHRRGAAAVGAGGADDYWTSGWGAEGGEEEGLGTCGAGGGGRGGGSGFFPGP
jgi:hypothetical protein